MEILSKMPMQPELVRCPNCTHKTDIKIHSRKERRYRCQSCRRTFSERAGTPLAHLKTPLPIVLLVLSLLAHGCPIPALVRTFGLDERTIASWQLKCGYHAKRIQFHYVCRQVVGLGQVQADELKVKMQGGSVWIATAVIVFSRLFIWGTVSAKRDKRMVATVLTKVKRCSGRLIQPVLFATDGFAAYPNVIKKIFSTPDKSQKMGRKRRIVWPDIHIVQVIKRKSGNRIKEIERRLIYGVRGRAAHLLTFSQTTVGSFNTAYVERLNATLRARMPSLVRRTRNLARTQRRLDAELFWCAVVYNFCTVHTSLSGTPVMAAGLAERRWSIRELLFTPTPYVLPSELDHVIL